MHKSVNYEVALLAVKGEDWKKTLRGNNVCY